MSNEVISGAAVNSTAPVPEGHTRMWATVAHIGAANYEVKPGVWYRVGNNFQDRCLFVCNDDVSAVKAAGIAKPESELTNEEREKYGVSEPVEVPEITEADDTPAADPIIDQDLSSLTRLELTTIAANIGLSTKGKKSDLVARIEEFYANG